MSSALARAQRHCAESGLPPVEVFAVVVMSNHLHLVVRAPGKNLAAFMSYFLARVAQTLNLLLGRVGTVFPRRYDAQPILDEEAAAGRIKYVLENPKKAGLVKCFTEWPGFVAVAGLHDGEELETRHFDRSAWQLAKRPNERERYWRRGHLRLSRLPDMESLSCSAYLATVKSWCDSRPADRCLGVEGVLDADVNQRPRKPKRSRCPYAFGSPENVGAYREASRLRYAAYDAARALAPLGGSALTRGPMASRNRAPSRTVSASPRTIPLQFPSITRGAPSSRSHFAARSTTSPSRITSPSSTVAPQPRAFFIFVASSSRRASGRPRTRVAVFPPRPFRSRESTILPLPQGGAVGVEADAGGASTFGAGGSSSFFTESAANGFCLSGAASGSMRFFEAMFLPIRADKPCKRSRDLPGEPCRAILPNDQTGVLPSAVSNTRYSSGRRSRKNPQFARSIASASRSKVALAKPSSVRPSSETLSPRGSATKEEP